MAESAVVRACLDYLLRLRKLVAWRSNNAGIFSQARARYIFHGLKGVPDIIVILPGGRFLGVECKSETGRQSEAQAVFQERCEQAGGLYLLVRSAAELAEKMKELERG